MMCAATNERACTTKDTRFTRHRRTVRYGRDPVQTNKCCLSLFVLLQELHRRVGVRNIRHYDISDGLPERGLDSNTVAGVRGYGVTDRCLDLRIPFFA